MRNGIIILGSKRTDYKSIYKIMNNAKLETNGNLIMIKILLLIVLLFLASHALAFSAETIIQTGVASPQSKAEQNNIERLRERAIRNAMNLAVLQITGAMVSGERGDSTNFKEEITIIDDNVSEQTKQKSRTHGSVTSRTTGYVRLVEIIKEWHENQQYYVKARIEVGDQKETTQKMNAGFYWERVGKPPLAFNFSEKTNNQDTTRMDAYTLRYLRDNLIQNGILTSEEGRDDIHYLINVMQSSQTKQMSEFGTYTTHCRLSYQIIDKKRQQTVAEYRATHGPDAGFTEEQAQESCIKAIAPQVSEKMIREIATIMSNIWNQGTEYQLCINGLPGELVTQISDTLKNLFQVNNISNISYRSNKLKMAMMYKGTAINLAEMITVTFDEFDSGVVTKTIQDNQLQFQWIQK